MGYLLEICLCINQANFNGNYYVNIIQQRLVHEKNCKYLKSIFNVDY